MSDDDECSNLAKGLLIGFMIGLIIAALILFDYKLLTECYLNSTQPAINSTQCEYLLNKLTPEVL